MLYTKIKQLGYVPIYGNFKLAFKSILFLIITLRNNSGLKYVCKMTFALISRKPYLKQV